MMMSSNITSVFGIASFFMYHLKIIIGNASSAFVMSGKDYKDI